MHGTETTTKKPVRQLDRVVIRFAGDSGDGMQLTGDRFTSETASLGNDLSTLPNFPAEIRAPQGTLPGVSSFQLHFADHAVLTPGDSPDVLVAMNPAALRANLGDLSSGATILALTALFGAALFPNMMVSSLGAEYNLTIYNSASSQTTLRIMQIVAFLGLPFVLSYSAAVYWVFRGKVKLDDTSY